MIARFKDLPSYAKALWLVVGLPVALLCALVFLDGILAVIDSLLAGAETEIRKTLK